MIGYHCQYDVIRYFMHVSDPQDFASSHSLSSGSKVKRSLGLPRSNASNAISWLIGIKITLLFSKTMLPHQIQSVLILIPYVFFQLKKDHTLLACSSTFRYSYLKQWIASQPFQG